MPRAVWPLGAGRPVIEVVLTQAPSGQPITRTLLADTGAGSRQAGYELILDEQDCLSCGGAPFLPVLLGGAITGSFPTYRMRLRIPAVAFDQPILVVGVPLLPPGLDGFACFRFLSRFTYGNFGNPDEFGIEM